MKKTILFILLVCSSVFITGCVKDRVLIQKTPFSLNEPPIIPRLTAEQEDFLFQNHNEIYDLFVEMHTKFTNYIKENEFIVDEYNKEVR